MSSSPTAPTSTTASSTSFNFPALELARLRGAGRARPGHRGPAGLAGRRTALPAVLHNRPQKIIIEAERAVVPPSAPAAPWPWPTPTAVPTVRWTSCAPGTGVRRLPGLHCYDVFGGPAQMAAMFGAEPGTYVLTDFLLRSFDRLVLAELGLDRYPQLWPDYFGHYRRLVWLAQEPTPALAAEAERVAEMFGLPLTGSRPGSAGWRAPLAALVEEAS